MLAGDFKSSGADQALYYSMLKVKEDALYRQFPAAPAAKSAPTVRQTAHTALGAAPSTQSAFDASGELNVTAAKERMAALTRVEVKNGANVRTPPAATAPRTSMQVLFSASSHDLANGASSGTSSSGEQLASAPAMSTPSLASCAAAATTPASTAATASLAGASNSVALLADARADALSADALRGTSASH